MQNIYVFVFIRGGRHKVIGFLLVCSLFIGGVWNFLLFVLRFFVYFKWCFKAYFSLVVF